MTRSIFGVIAVAVGLGIISGPGCAQTGVGDPCIPEQEYDPTFQGFSPKEVNVESRSFQCQTRVCLANHFQGRVSCPYGQDLNGAGPSPETTGCIVPGSSPPEPVTGNADPTVAGGKIVQPQCVDRTADKAVYCSCRCADAPGTSTGGTLCSCPDGFQCAQLVTPIGDQDEQLAGGYCIKTGTAYNTANSCVSTCVASSATGGNCGPSSVSF
jgi:hypothetical protein